jgi:outer membrane protein assembly factor BamD (BamD/ComL family)
VSERLTKRQLKQDRFLEFIQSGLAYAQQHALVVGASLVVFIAGVALAVRVAGSASGQPAESPEADRALSAARVEFSAGRMDAGREALEQVRSRHARTRAAREATYILANAYYEGGDWARAQEVFEEFLKRPLHADLMVDGARLGIASCKEESGDAAAAYEAYRRLWTDGVHGGTRIQAALAAGRIARTIGKVDEARALYEGIVKAYPNSPAASEARFALSGLPAA